MAVDRLNYERASIPILSAVSRPLARTRASRSPDRGSSTTPATPSRWFARSLGRRHGGASPLSPEAWQWNTRVGQRLRLGLAHYPAALSFDLCGRQRILAGARP